MTWQDPQAVQKFQAAEEVLRRQEPPRTLAVCRRCGVMPWNRDFEDWTSLANVAQHHADTAGKGHVVAATLVLGAIFRPQAASGEESADG